MGRTLEHIRPNNGDVRDDTQSGDVESAQGPEDIVENVEDAAENRAEAEEDVRKPKPASRPYTRTRTEVYEHEVIQPLHRCWCKHRV